MSVVNYQLITIGSMVSMAVLFWIYIGILERSNGELGEMVWDIHFQNRVNGIREFMRVPEGCYKLGNGWFNDISIKTNGEKVRLMLHVQKDVLYVSVLEGQIKINDRVYLANKKEKILVGDYTTVHMDNCHLKFERVR